MEDETGVRRAISACQEGGATMTTEPYTPDEAELIGCYAASMEEHAGEDYATAKADAERGIEAIKAKYWDAAIDFVSRHYEDYLPLNWQAKALTGSREETDG